MTDQNPKIRVLPADGPPPPPGTGGSRPRPPGRGPGIALVLLAAIAGVAIGYVFGAAGGGPRFGSSDSGDLDATSAIAAPPISEAPDPPEHSPDPAVVSPPATASGTSTTSSTTTSSTTPPAALGELVPGFTGTLVYVDGGTIYEWPHRLREPRVWALPDANIGDIYDVALDARGDTVAYIDHTAPAGPEDIAGVLYVGSMRSQAPFFIGATSVRWHQSEPGRLAWIGHDGTSGDRWLYTGAVRGEESEQVRVAPLLDSADVTETFWWLAEWGDWGFVMIRAEFDGDLYTNQQVLVTMDSTGAAIASRADLILAGVGPGGLMVVADAPEGDPGGSFGEFRAVGLDLESEMDLEFIGQPWNVTWSLDGSQHATSDGQRIVVVGPSGARTYPLSDRWPVAFSADGRFLATLSGTTSVIAVIDLAEESIHYVPVAVRPFDVRLGP